MNSTPTQPSTPAAHSPVTRVGQIVVDHVRDERQVQPTSERRRRHQHLAMALGEQHQVLAALVSHQLAVHARRSDGHGNKVLAEEIRARACVDEDDRAALGGGVLLAAQDVLEEPQLVVVGVSEEKVLLDVFGDLANAADVEFHCKQTIVCP